MNLQREFGPESPRNVICFPLRNNLKSRDQWANVRYALAVNTVVDVARVIYDVDSEIDIEKSRINNLMMCCLRFQNEVGGM